MLLTKREEQLLQAFLRYGKLSMDNIAAILKVSKRTAYRVLNDLTVSLNPLAVGIVKENHKYLLTGQLSRIADYRSQASFSKMERLNRITYHLLIADQEITNDELQSLLGVSNVTIIQDVAEVEERLASFGMTLKRLKGYVLTGSALMRRRLLAVLLSNNISLSDFWQGQMGYFKPMQTEHLLMALDIFQRYQQQLPEMDAKLVQYFVFNLALSNWYAVEDQPQAVSKTALDFAKKVYADFSAQTQTFYPIQEILTFAALLDTALLKRQETPLYQENFDSEFFYSVSNLIDKVALYTKIAFTKDQTLFKFLFNHLRLTLAVPILFAQTSVASLAHDAFEQNEYLHRVIKLLMMEIFPLYIQTESEWELVTLHFASSLRRSPHIYPVQVLLLTDERPLATELLVSRMKNIAPFIASIRTKSTRQLGENDFKEYDAILATKPMADQRIRIVSTFPAANEMVSLEQFLQKIQINREVKFREDTVFPMHLNLQSYLTASQAILQTFTLKQLHNQASFQQTIYDLVAQLSVVDDRNYLADKLIRRFQESPLAIPETNLALIHTQSHQVKQSIFMIFELEHPVKAKSMNGEDEMVSRILVMLTKHDEVDEVRELMTAISQSIIENHLYTEIYKKGNVDIIYHLLNHIFTDKIKKMEN
ncbi:BglG family transcription antiterminator [Streptococcus halichoeri]|uniref:BglG family transcription antiterminator n=1 Tax=Streptococcus halichoeri TaxID=254785 RepID=UPI001358DABF|nr:PTS sugar transporter subunit IIA [Streptococcus halichoeri]